MKYIPADKLIAEIDRQEIGYDIDGKHTAEYNTCKKILDIINSLQQDPRFPQYDNIVEKVFGAGNLEGWERDEAEILVALAKEELLKSLQQEQPEMDLEKEIDKTVSECTDGYNFDWDRFARHFYELGRKGGSK